MLADRMLSTEGAASQRQILTTGKKTCAMKRNLYAVRIEPGRMVAVEIPDTTAAVMLDLGRTILLATPSELAALARRQKRFLATLIRQRPPVADGNRSAFPVFHAARVAQPEGVC
jgi:hypothetical protein